MALGVQFEKSLVQVTLNNVLFYRVFCINREHKYTQPRHQIR